jgi:hypothetical protein
MDGKAYLRGTMRNGKIIEGVIEVGSFTTVKGKSIIRLGACRY